MRVTITKEGNGVVTEQWDVIVAGGGPAGSAPAIRARQLGYRALVLEAETFPRHHVGESLIYLWSIFEGLGVADEMDATFQHKKGSVRIWGTEDTPRPTEFGSRTSLGRRHYSLQVERSLFDLLLSRQATSVGAEVRHGHRVTEVLWEGERAYGVRYRGPGVAQREAHAPFVVDATGRAALIARTRGLQVLDP